MQIIESPTGGRSTPWDSYADGQWRLAQPGTDYDDPRKFAKAGYRWAARHGCKFSAHKVTGGVEFLIEREGSDDANR